MPRHDQRDDFMMRERGERDYRDFDDRDRGAFFGGGRRELRMRREKGGWGDLMSDESSGGRMRSRSGHREERSYGPDDDRRGIATDETERLIASNKVEGTPVYDRHGDRLGSIQNFMVDKFRGKVVYAVLRHSSGFLGLDERFYPLDWDQLTFDTRLGGYHIDMTEDQLKSRGSWDKNERWRERSSGMRPDRDRFDRERELGRSRAYDREPW